MIRGSSVESEEQKETVKVKRDYCASRIVRMTSLE